MDTDSDRQTRSTQSIDDKPTRVLVTGAAGFIGKRLVRALSGAGYSVHALDWKPLDDVDGADATYRVDILDASSLRNVFEGANPQTVVHLAARTDLEEKENLSAYAANIDGVHNLTDCVRRTPSVTRCIYTSSQLVCHVGYEPQHERDYRPTTLYGHSKVLTEIIVREADGGDVTWCLVRPTTVWGPGMSAHYQRFFRAVAGGYYFHVGKRPLLKSYGYVDNLVHQYQRLLEVDAERIHRQTLYLADYEPLDLRLWADRVQQLLGAPRIRTVPFEIASLLARCGDLLTTVGLRNFPFTTFRLNNIVTTYRFDLSKTRSICGEVPFDFEAGVAELVDWLKSIGIGAGG